MTAWLAAWRGAVSTVGESWGRPAVFADRLLHVFYVACCDVFGRVGVAGYVALGAVAETSFQFVCVGAGGFCQTESEGVTEVVGS